jgi:MFS family permease
LLGPLVGGQLVDAASWRWVFAINLPVVVATILLIRWVMPEERRRAPAADIDVLGAALCASGLIGITFGLIEQPLRGFADPAVFLPLQVGHGGDSGH